VRGYTVNDPTISPSSTSFMSPGMGGTMAARTSPSTASVSGSVASTRATSRGRTRTPTVAGTSGPTLATELPAAQRLVLWADLMVIQSALADCEGAQAIARDCGLHEALGVLMRLAPCWASHASLAAIAGIGAAAGSISGHGHLNAASLSSPMSVYATWTSPAAAGMTAGGTWSPTPYQVAGAALAASCGFAHSNVSCKRKLASAIESKVALLPTASNKPGTAPGSTLYQLLSVGLSKEVAAPVRWLSLALIGTIAIDSQSSSLCPGQTLSSQLQNIAQSLNTAIQKSLHHSFGSRDHPAISRTGSRGPSEAIVHLLDAYAACICAEGNDADLVASSGRNRNTDPASGDFPALPAPELLVWVRDSATASPASASTLPAAAAHAAVLRSLGLMAATSCGSLMAQSTAVPRRRLLANVTSEVPIGILTDAARCAQYKTDKQQKQQQHPAVTATASVALWSALHASEQARAIARSSGLTHSTAVEWDLGNYPHHDYDYGYTEGQGQTQAQAQWAMTAAQSSHIQVYPHASDFMGHTTLRARHAIALLMQ
jgi:hypothetical protein